MGKLINRIPGSRILISSLPGSALRTHVESQASRCQQAFSKPCLVNLISKDTHLVFSIYRTLCIPGNSVVVPHFGYCLAIWQDDVSRTKTVHNTKGAYRTCSKS